MDHPGSPGHIMGCERGLLASADGPAILPHPGELSPDGQPHRSLLCLCRSVRFLGAYFSASVGLTVGLDELVVFFQQK